MLPPDPASDPFLGVGAAARPEAAGERSRDAKGPQAACCSSIAPLVLFSVAPLLDGRGQKQEVFAVHVGYHFADLDCARDIVHPFADHGDPGAKRRRAHG